MTPEKRVQNSIINYLKELQARGEHLFFERRQACGGNYKAGIPDLYIVYEHIHIEVEVKAPNGRLSVMQEKYRDICRTNGTPWICACALDDFVHDFNKIVEEYI